MEVARRIQMANGIEITNDGRFVIVVSTLGKKLIVYDRDTAATAGVMNRLTLRESHRIPTPGLCDNLAWIYDKSGVQTSDLLSACHPKALTFVYYSKAPRTRTSPVRCSLEFYDLFLHNNNIYYFSNSATSCASAVSCVSRKASGERVRCIWMRMEPSSPAAQPRRWRQEMTRYGSVPCTLVVRCGVKQLDELS